MIELGRRPYPFRTSHRIDELELAQADGTILTALLKDLRWSELGPAAQPAKPTFLHDPRREISAYRILAGTGLGTPTCYDAGDHWLLLEKVDGVELWQVGELETWIEAARWLARFHRSFESEAIPAEHLIQYDLAFFKVWPERAARRHPALTNLLRQYDRVVDLLCQQPPTMIHGEFYASNVMVAGARIAPVDWEMAGIGPAALDLAALISGWGPDETTALLAGYGEMSLQAIEAARLHLALQWLGWSAEWSPPPEHARDWLAEAMGAAARLGI